MWDVFREHHYLSGEINVSSHWHLIYWNDILVAFQSSITVPTGTTKNLYRGHRIVVLPDYQNLGIGGKINDFFGEYYLKQGKRFVAKTSHARMLNHFKNSPYWKPTSTNDKASGHISYDRGKKPTEQQQKNFSRLCGSYEYVGKEFNKPHLEIIIDDYKDSLDELKEILSKLKQQYYIEFYHGIAGVDDNIDKITQELLITTSTLKIKRNGNISIKKAFIKKDIINSKEDLLKYLNKNNIKEII